MWNHNGRTSGDLDTVHATLMYEAYCTYVADEDPDNRDCDDGADGNTDSDAENLLMMRLVFVLQQGASEITKSFFKLVPDSGGSLHLRDWPTCF